MLIAAASTWQPRKGQLVLLLFAGSLATPAVSVAQAIRSPRATFSRSTNLPEAPHPQVMGTQTPAHRVRTQQGEELTWAGTPKRIALDELRIVTSPARVRSRDLVWLLPVAGATAASLATDTRTMRDVVSHDPGFNNSAVTSSDALLGLFIGGPAALLGAGQFLGDAKTREAGLLAGEAMVNSYVTGEGIKYITLRERPFIQNARGHFFQGDAASNPSFVSGHSIAAWSSAAVLASEYSRPWQQAGLYTLATGVSLTRVLGQQHFPTDALLGSVSGWLIGKYVYLTHHIRSAQ